MSIWIFSQNRIWLAFYFFTVSNVVLQTGTITSAEDFMANDNFPTGSCFLEQARALIPPVPEKTEYGETEGSEFWEQHASLLALAWKEWEATANLPTLELEDLLEPNLYHAIRLAWKNRDEASERRVRALCVSVVEQLGVYSVQLFQPSQIHKIRSHIDGASFDQSKIPTRRPNGMNRYGLLLYPSSIEGSVQLAEFTRFYEELVDLVVRPLGRLLFPEYVGKEAYHNDAYSYAFTIRYKSGEDLSLSEHSDASLITLNVNLNTPEESDDFTGSTLYFVTPNDSEMPTQQHRQNTNPLHYNVTFDGRPGLALLHLGQLRHGANDIQSGARTNMVIWLHGPDGHVRIAPYPREEQMTTAQQRWNTLSSTKEKLSSLPFDEL